MSASVGLGGGKGSSEGTQSTASPAAIALANIAQQFASETTGVRTGLIQAMQEVLATGGSTLPIISRAVEQTRRAGSTALQNLDERLALTGLAGTPEGERIRGEQQLESEIVAGQTKQQLAQNIFGMISNFVLGQSQTATSGLAGAIPGLQTTSKRGSEKALGANTGFAGKIK